MLHKSTHSLTRCLSSLILFVVQTHCTPQIITVETQTVKGVANGKLPFNTSQIEIEITMHHHPQMEVVTVVITMVNDH
jgi:hypothetical protein